MKTFQSLVILTSVILMSSCNQNKFKMDASGVFESTEILVSSQASGEIKALNITEGENVKADQILGYIDTNQLHFQKLQIQASKSIIESRQTDVPKQIAALKQQIETQKKEYNRFKNLLRSNAATQKQVDDILASINILNKQLAAQTELLNNGNLAVTAQIVQLKAQIAQINDQISKSVIKSPIDGVILAKYTELGELASPGKALYKVADIDHMFLRAYITAAQLSQCKLGDSVKIYADFGEKDKQEYTGIISWVSDKSEFTPKTIQTRDERANLVYATKIAVNNNGLLKQGMYGEMKF